MKSKIIAWVVGTLVIFFLWLIVFLALNGIFEGNIPWPLPGFVAIICPLAGGYVVTRMEQTQSTLISIISGASAGMIVFLAIIISGRIATNIAFISLLLVFVGAFCGGLGAFITRSAQDSA
jgi:hypothetical protein